MSPTAPTGWIAEVESGPGRGLRLLIEDEPIFIGSGEAAHLRLPGDDTSPYHVELAPDGEALVVRDLGSRTGTGLALLDGQIDLRWIRLSSAAELLVGGSRIGLLPRRDAGPGLAAAPVRPSPKVTQPEADTEPVDDAASRLAGRSPAMRRARASIRTYAKNDAPVLITGETGTGKELAARAIHALSARHGGPWSAVNCGAIPKELAESILFGHARGAFSGATTPSPGVFVEAHGGTLFLDEINALPLDVQPKLLRALQESEIRPVGGPSRRVDVRIIAAANAELPGLVNEKQFRDDLFHRLNVLPLRLPPLRERREDIDALVPKLLLAIASKWKIEPGEHSQDELIRLAKEREFPGNVRELEGFLAKICAGTLSAEDVAQADGLAPVDRLWSLPLEAAEREFRKLYFMRLLESTGGRVNEAAELAGVNRATVYRWK